MIGIGNIINTIGGFYSLGNKINSILGLILSVIVIHYAFYYVIGMFFTRKFKPAKKKHKYGILIAARNEEKVIGNLIDSINKQDYPKDLYKVFVVADNCTDNTASIARKYGAVVYERADNEHRTKGFALQFLVENIRKDYGIETFEGYFIFDADNLIKKNYINKMNDAFDAGLKIITSFRNTKNFDESWVASMYALHWIRSIRTKHRARSVLHLATNIQGTGFLFANEIIKDGWKYTSLTEDRALTADAVAQGYEISYQDEAEFYDEQPTKISVALRQRLRWAKGHLQAFRESGPYLFMNIFLGKRFVRTKWNHEEKEYSSMWRKILESIRHRFASFDTLVQLTPTSIINLCRWLLFSVIVYSFYTYTNGISNVAFFRGGSFFASTLRNLNGLVINISPGMSSLFIGLLLAIWWRILYRIGAYLSNISTAVYLFLIENKRIKKFSIWKKIFYCFTWPIYDVIERYVKVVALFAHVTWQPIIHESKVTIEDLKV